MAHDEWLIDVVLQLEEVGCHIASAFLHKSTQELLEERRRRKKWLMTPAGRKSQERSKRRAKLVREGKLRPDKDRSKIAKRAHNVYQGGK